MPEPAADASPALRDRLVIVTCVAVLTALAWSYLIRVDRQMSAARGYADAMAAMGMSMNASWTASDAGATFVMWLVMMIGMMAASAVPVLLLFSATTAARHQVPAVPVMAFGGGYLAVWAGFSVAATLAQWALHERALLSPSMRTSSPWLGGTILVAAGVYQLTPLKTVCLSHCRSPLGFLMSKWRNGVAGAFRMGASHGAFCLGCCWALMGVLFVAGVMNLLWVAVLAVVVLLEKVAPAGLLVARVTGVAMLLGGIAMGVSAL